MNRLWHRAFAATAFLTVAAATLTPTRGREVSTFACVMCGERAVADALLNVLLFLPVGAALALLGLAPRRAAIAGVLLSGLIELAQLHLIPGRDASLGDILMNGLGTAAGARLAVSAHWWLRPPARRARPLALGSTILAAALAAAPAWLLQPAYPTGAAYYGQWTPNLRHLEWYRGRVVEARLGDLSIPPRRIDRDSVRTLLATGARLQIRAVAGPAPPGLASLFSIYDARQREVLLLGPDGDDLVLRVHRRAAAWRLDMPEVRFPDMLRGIEAGDTLEIVLWGEANSRCASVNRRSACGRLFSAASGWTLFLYPERLPWWTYYLLDGGWIAGLIAPIAFWGWCALRSRR